MRGVRHPRCVAMPLTPRPRVPPMRARAAVRSVMKAAARRGVALLARMGASGRAPAHLPLRPKRKEPPLHAVQSSFQQTDAAEKVGRERE